MTSQRPLLLAGCGKMGGAMLAGWVQGGRDPDAVWVVEPSEPARRAIAAEHGVRVVADAGELPGDLAPEVVVLAVKPQMMDDVAPAYARFAAPGCVFISVAAGKPIAYFEARLGAEAAIVRAMPNTPAAIGRGITVGCANGHVGAAQRDLCDRLLAAVGEVAWVDDEDQIDAVTAVSGGGPAYVFLLTECLAAAGVDAGLPRELADRLARATVSGAGELMRQSEGTPPATLRENVTSPGGTTAEALKVLGDADALPRLMREAIAAAARRSSELAG